MTISTKIQRGFLATAVALAFAAPSAFADTGKTVRGIHTDQGGSPDSPAASHSEQVMKKKSTAVAPDSGKTVGGMHTDAGGTPDAPAAIHTERVMKKKSGTMATVVPLSKPAY